MLNDQGSFTSLSELNGLWPNPSSGAIASFVLILSFVIFSAIELQSPRKKVNKQLLRQSYTANLSLFIFNSLVISLLSASTLCVVAKQHITQGLLHAITTPSLKVILSLLALDLLLYCWHRACHRYDILWMFHKVHHNDPYLNVSTGFRVHISESFMTYGLKLMAIILLGIDERIVLVSEIVTTLFVLFHHTNSAFKDEKWLGYVFTTPTMHRTHHSIERKEHDNNYGAVLIIWDRLLGTFLEREPSEIGIRGYSPLDFFNLVKFGFVQKPPVPMPVSFDHMIAEAAYYKAEKRNFIPGHEWDDWLEAKCDILNMVSKWDSRLQAHSKETLPALLCVE